MVMPGYYLRGYSGNGFKKQTYTSYIQDIDEARNVIHQTFITYEYDHEKQYYRARKRTINSEFEAASFQGGPGNYFKRYPCPQCDYRSVTPKKLHWHVVLQHLDVAALPQNIHELSPGVDEYYVSPYDFDRLNPNINFFSYNGCERIPEVKAIEYPKKLAITFNDLHNSKAASSNFEKFDVVDHCNPFTSELINFSNHKQSPVELPGDIQLNTAEHSGNFAPPNSLCKYQNELVPKTKSSSYFRGFKNEEKSHVATRQKLLQLSVEKNLRNHLLKTKNVQSPKPNRKNNSVASNYKKKLSNTKDNEINEKIYVLSKNIKKVESNCDNLETLENYIIEKIRNMTENDKIGNINPMNHENTINESDHASNNEDLKNQKNRKCKGKSILIHSLRNSGDVILKKSETKLLKNFKDLDGKPSHGIGNTVKFIRSLKNRSNRQTLVNTSYETRSNNRPVTRSQLKNNSKKINVQQNLNNILSCTDCDYVGKTAGSLNYHSNKIHGKIGFHCSDCAFSANRIVTLHRHQVRVHNYPRPYACDHCNYRAIIKQDLTSHILCRHPKKSILSSCPQCNFKADSSDSLKQHITGHKKPPGPSGFGCSKKTHRADNSKNLDTKPSLLLGVQQKLNNIFSCTDCDYVGKTAGSLNYHSNKIHGKTGFRCSDCAFHANRIAILHRHQVRVHNYPHPYACDHCNHRSITQPDLTDHILNRHPEKRILSSCPQCNFTADSSGALKQHIASHKKSPGHSGFGCSKNTRRADIVSYHKPDNSKNLGNKPSLLLGVQQNLNNIFSCTDCDYVGITARSLNYHSNKVHGKMGFRCSDCVFSANKIVLLHRHQVRVHNYPPPYTCDHCNYRATSKFNIKRHIERHHIVNRKSQPFPCTKCNYGAYSKSALVLHQRRQHSLHSQ